MLQTCRILVSTFNHGGFAVIALLGLAGCGQTGPLYLPTEPAAAQRATLPQALWPVMPKKPAQSSRPAPPAAPSAAPASAPTSAPTQP
ncbi:MAG: LPS translocon maturation chaperone LptM [Curvibacter sp.]|nr:lipoprotein [Curvibacter sp.]